MRIRTTLRWTIIYRTITVGALVLGLALVAAGLLVGFGGAITELLADPLNPGSASAQADPVITLLFVALGVVIWQLGKTYALFVTLPRAAGQAAGRQLDANRLASEVHDTLDDRLATIEADLEETRRAVRSLEDDGRTATFDERDHVDADDDTPALESGAAETATASTPRDDHTATEDVDDAIGENGDPDDTSDPLA